MAMAELVSKAEAEPIVPADEAVEDSLQSTSGEEAQEVVAKPKKRRTPTERYQTELEYIEGRLKKLVPYIEKLNKRKKILELLLKVEQYKTGLEIPT